MDSENVPFLGFLTVIDHSRYGLIGGFLVLNQVGRPVEFHCTAPVKASRAQEILFGNTLQTYLYGEQIAQTLIRRAKSQTALVVTNVVHVLSVQDFIEQPVIYVAPVQEEENAYAHSGSSPQQTAHTRERVDHFLEGGSDLFAYSEKKHQQHRSEPLRSIAGLSVARWKEHLIEDSVLWIPEDRKESVPEILQRLNDYSLSIDFTEPFSRIALALEEAQKAA